MHGSKPQKFEIRRVFLSSPNDLEDEKRSFSHIIERVNKIKAEPIGIHLIPIGWENMPPEQGRPQEIINKSLEAADLVIFLLWKRWGSPTGTKGTPKYSSGFEEEYYEAIKHNKDMLFYFRSIPIAMLEDPGKQLEKVLRFREMIETNKIGIYKPYETVAELEENLLIHLCQWVDGISPIMREIDKLQIYPNIIENLERELALSITKREKAALELVKQAQIHANDGKITLAETCFAQAMSIHESDYIVQCYGDFLIHIGSLNKALDKFNGLLQSAERNLDNHSMAIALTYLGDIQRIKGNLTTAKKSYNRALELSGKTGDKAGIAKLHGNLGIVHFLLDNLTTSKRLHGLALRIFKEIGDMKGMASELNYLGIVNYLADNFDESIGLLQEALRINKKSRFSDGMADNYANLGIVYHKLREFSEAESMYKKALRIYKRLQFKAGIANIYGNLGSLYESLGECQKAEKYHKDSLEIEVSLGRMDGMGSDYANLGRLYHFQNRLHEASKMYNKAIQLFNKTKNKSKIKIVKTWLNEIRNPEAKHISSIEQIVTANTKINRPARTAKRVKFVKSKYAYGSVSSNAVLKYAKSDRKSSAKKKIEKTESTNLTSRSRTKRLVACPKGKKAKKTAKPKRKSTPSKMASRKKMSASRKKIKIMRSNTSKSKAIATKKTLPRKKPAASNIPKLVAKPIKKRNEKAKK